MTAPTIAVTWADVHVGDVAAGKDGAGWQVRGREPGERWVGAGGRSDIFTLRSLRDGREIRAGMQLDRPVRLIERADHTDKAESVDALLAAGFTVQILKEGSMSDTSEQHERGGVETFGGPAPVPAGVAPETDAQRCARGEHPPADRSTLKDGRVFCTRCMSTVASPSKDVPGAPQAATPAPDGGNGGSASITGSGAPPNPEPCAHPAEALRAIIDGSTWCSLCKTTVVELGGTIEVGGVEFTKIGTSPFPDPLPAGSLALPVASAVHPPQCPCPRPECVALSLGGSPADPDGWMGPPAQPVDAIADPAPRREAPRGKWGWYKLPHPITGEPDKIWPRVSTIAKTLADESGLTVWKQRMVAKGLAMRPDLIAVAVALDVDMDKSKLDEVVKSAMEKAESTKGANYGTALHKFTERLDNGEGIGSMSIPAALVADVEAYARTLKDHGLEVLPQYTERTIVNATHEYAGTWDRIVRHKPTGALRVLDVKSGQDLSRSWLEIGVQEAGYANGEHVALRTFDGYEPMPEVDKLKALVLHLPIGSARGEIYGVDIAKGWRSLLTSIDARNQRSDAKNWSWLVKPQAPADVIRLHLQRAETQDEFAAIAQNAITRGLWTDELAAYAVERFDIVRVRAATYDGLAALWAELYPLGRWTEAVNAAALERATAVMPVVPAAA